MRRQRTRSLDNGWWRRGGFLQHQLKLVVNEHKDCWHWRSGATTDPLWHFSQSSNADNTTWSCHKSSGQDFWKDTFCLMPALRTQDHACISCWESVRADIKGMNISIEHWSMLEQLAVRPHCGTHCASQGRLGKPCRHSFYSWTVRKSCSSHHQILLILILIQYLWSSTKMATNTETVLLSLDSARCFFHFYPVQSTFSIQNSQ